MIRITATRMLAALVFATAGLIAATLATAPSAYATWPGSDGRIAFIRGNNVFTMDPHGTHVQRVTAFRPGTDIDIASWSPDSTKLVFGHGQAQEPPQLWTVNANGTDAHKVFDDPDFADQFPSFTPNGRAIVFMHCSDVGCPIYRVRLDGTGLTAITPTQPDIIDIAPTLAPNDSALTFGSLNRGGVDAGVYIASPTGADPRLLTPPELQAFTPDWSPDSGTIVFQSNALGSIYTIRPDGTDLTLLTSTPTSHDQVPSWSPEGDAIAFERNTADFSSVAVWVMRPDGTGLRLIKDNARAPRWSSATR
jgi:Tol biopolymer transport system component